MSDLPTAKTRPASNWSAIWILPLIALMIGGWLAWQAYRDAGVEIEVRFESGEGIVANKTEVIYKGMPVGKVKSLVLDAKGCLLYTSPSPRDLSTSRMPSSA